MQKIIFVADERHLNSPISGGVQLCTNEYINLFEGIGCQLTIVPIRHTRKFWPRFLLKLGLNVYNRYDFRNHARVINLLAKEKGTSLIALNQVDLIGLAPLLKKQLDCRIILLSHGNESGDFLHEISRRSYNPVLKLRDIVRLGFVIFKESRYFINYIDIALSVSETEKQINNWLGVPESIYIPRTYKPDFLQWTPVLGRIGFVGTLNHKPNIDGLVLLLDEIQKMSLSGIEFRVVGGPSDAGMLLEKKYSFLKYIGFIDDDQFRLEASTWSVFVNPVFWYSRGVTTKLAQAINMGLPIISTEPGNRGYKFIGEKPMTAKNPEEMAGMICNNALDKEKIKILAGITQRIALSGPQLKEIGKFVESKLLNL